MGSDLLIPSLGPFSLIHYAVFVCTTLLLGYPLHRILAHYFDWEARKKSAVKHYADMLLALVYSTLTFALGNYSETYNWVSILFFYVGLIGLSLILELPFAKTSLPHWRDWSKRTWILIIFAIVAIGIFLVYHLYIAAGKEDNYIFYYAIALTIPFVLLGIGILVFHHQVGDRFGLRIYFDQMRSWKWNKKNGWASCGNGGPAPLESERSAPNDPVERVPPGTRDDPACRDDGPTLVFHIHHWQIFYAIAFFTRFDTFGSQMAAGLVLGIYMQGVAAYGMDGFFEEAGPFL